MTLRSAHEIRVSWLIGVVLFLASATFAQVPVESPSPSPSPSPSETARPLYGLQGVLIETLDGKVVASQSENEQFNPASTMKLVTALVALRTLGPGHRFATGIWTDGVLDKATGDVEIAVNDTGRFVEHAVRPNAGREAMARPECSQRHERGGEFHCRGGIELFVL